MLLDLIDLSKLRRAIIYGLLLAGIMLVQNHIAARLPALGVRPLLIPAMVVAVGLFEDGMWGGFLGLAAGYFTDMASGDHVVMFTILLSVAGFFAGAMGKYMLHKGFVSFLFLAVLVLSASALGQMARFLFFLEEDARAFQRLVGGTWPLWRTGLIQTLYSLVWAVPIYFPCKAIAARPMGR